MALNLTTCSLDHGPCSGQHADEWLPIIEESSQAMVEHQQPNASTKSSIGIRLAILG